MSREEGVGGRERRGRKEKWEGGKGEEGYSHAFRVYLADPDEEQNCKRKPNSPLSHQNSLRYRDSTTRARHFAKPCPHKNKETLHFN